MNTKEQFEIKDGPGRLTSEILAECRSLFPVWCWHGGKLRVDWTRPDDRYSRLRSRVAVGSGTLSLSSSSALPTELVINGITYIRK